MNLQETNLSRYVYNNDQLNRVETSMSNWKISPKTLGEKQFSHQLALAWNNLTYHHQPWFSGEKIPILSQVKGQVNFGTLTALMGPSGSGKTTLLRCINQCNRSGISPKSEIYGSKKIPLIPCYIVEDDREHLLMGLTAKESLMFASRLKNRGAVTNEFDHEMHVMKIMDELMIINCCNTLVGTCSGGEKKRIVIAQELTSHIMPNLICIDEPTSGLDSNAAERVISCLQNIARKHNLAIVTSIHQPNNEILTLFDQLYVIAKAGRCVFMGPPNTLKAHMTECGISIANWQIPIEVLLKITSQKSKKMITESNIEVSDLGPPDEVVTLMVKTYEDQSFIENRCKTKGRLLMNGFERNDRLFHFKDFGLLFWRSILYSWIRDWKFIIMMAFVYIASTFLFTRLYDSDIGTDGACIKIKEIINGTNVIKYYIREIPIKRRLCDESITLMSTMLVLWTFIHVVVESFTFPAEIRIFLNEHRNGWYSTTSYYIAKSLTEMPIIAIILHLCAWILYYVTSQPDMNHWYEGIWDMPERFAYFSLSSILGIITTQGQAIGISIVLAHNYQLSTMTSVLIWLINFLFMGFFVPLESLNPILKVIFYPSYIRHMYAPLLIAMYGNGRCPNGSEMIYRFNIEDTKSWIYFLVEMTINIVWRMIGYIVLCVRANSYIIQKIKNMFSA